MAAVAAFLAVLAATGLAFAARAGTLDDSFGRGGKTYLKDVTGYPEAVAVGRHGRIVAAGFATSATASSTTRSVTAEKSGWISGPTTSPTRSRRPRTIGFWLPAAPARGMQAATSCWFA